MSLNVLFICTMNQWRSPTAEKVYAKHPRAQVRSRGTSSKARRTIAEEDLKWADVIFFMERKHQQRVASQFPGEMRYQECHVLDIPDEYKYMDPDLVTEIEALVGPLLSTKLESE